MASNLSHWLRRCLLAAGVLLALLLALAAAAAWWLGSGDFRQRVEREASAALGVPVAAQALGLSLWPLPGAAVDGLVLHSNPPVRVDRVEVRPALGTLLSGRPELAVMAVRGASLSQAAIGSLLQKLQQQSASRHGLSGNSSAKAGILLAIRRLDLDGVRWQSEAGWSSTLAGDVRLSPAFQPESADVRVQAGRWQGVRLRLVADAAAGGASGGGAGPLDGAWQLVLDVGGGTVRGPLTLKTAGGVQLTASLQTRGVAVEALAGHPTLTGLLDADTQIHGQARDFAALAQALRTQTTFTVKGAVINGLDLARAVKTVGMSRGGQTRLDTLSGSVATRESPKGRAVQVSQLEARSGLLGASGQAAISPAQQLSGRISVDLPGGVVGVPLELGGTVAAPQVTLTRGAMLGAAVGTVILPGVGTGAGAKLGDRLGEGLKVLFGGK